MAFCKIFACINWYPEKRCGSEFPPDRRLAWQFLKWSHESELSFLFKLFRSNCWIANGVVNFILFRKKCISSTEINHVPSENFHYDVLHGMISRWTDQIHLFSICRSVVSVIRQRNDRSGFVIDSRSGSEFYSIYLSVTIRLCWRLIYLSVTSYVEIVMS